MNDTNVTITWNNDNTVDKITYSQQILYDVINSYVKKIKTASDSESMLPPELLDIIYNLLNEFSLVSDPDQEMKRIYLADNIFEHLISTLNQGTFHQHIFASSRTKER